MNTHGIYLFLYLFLDVGSFCIKSKFFFTLSARIKVASIDSIGCILGRVSKAAINPVIDCQNTWIK